MSSNYNIQWVTAIFKIANFWRRGIKNGLCDIAEITVTCNFSGDIW